MHDSLKSTSYILLVLYRWMEGMFLTLVPRSWRFKDITGEIALVTGAGSGLGRLLALNLSKRGAILVLWDINAAGNAETRELIRKEGGQATAYQVDISDKDSVCKTAAKVKDEVGIVTILVNNAGIVTGKNFLDLTDSSVEKTFTVNAISHFWIVKSFLPDMIARDKGHLVTIASLAGLGGLPKLTDYCASKFAAVGFLEALTIELYEEGKRNIHTTTVCPYFINTGMFAGADTKLIGMLSPEYVADEVLTGLLSNQALVLIPRAFYFLYPLKTLLPTRSLLALLEVFGAPSSMKRFIGRESKAKSL